MEPDHLLKISSEIAGALAVRRCTAIREHECGPPGNEFFSDGITVEIVNAPTQIENLPAPARTSAFERPDGIKTRT